MSDERKCYAGDLTSDAIGKRVRFHAEGLETAGRPITRTVLMVTHKLSFFTGKPATEIGADEEPGLLRQSFTVKSDSIVEVLP